jgi:hypothetical protein
MVLCAVVLVGRPTLVRHWDIYASSTGGPRASYPLFLGPFPTAFSCEVEARIIVQSGGHAFCASRLALESGNRHQEQLLAEFWPSARWIALCEARLARRPRPSNAAAASLR